MHAECCIPRLPVLDKCHWMRATGLNSLLSQGEVSCNEFKSLLLDQKFLNSRKQATVDPLITLGLRMLSPR